MEIFDAQVAGRLFFPWEPLNIMPIGDIQYAGGGDDGVAHLKLLRAYVKLGLDNNCWFLNMGDNIDFLSPSNRQRLKAAGLYDTAEGVMDYMAEELERAVAKILAPTRGRWITWVRGHHYYEHLDGTTSDERLCDRLGGIYGGDCALITLTFQGRGGEVVMTKILVHHGSGGGSTLAGPLAALERKAAYHAAQVLFVGHVHRQQFVPFPFLDSTNTTPPHLYSTTRAICLTGSYLRGYMQGSKAGNRPQGGYVEKAFMNPVALGSPWVTFTPARIRLPNKQRYTIVKVRGSVGDLA